MYCKDIETMFGIQLDNATKSLISCYGITSRDNFVERCYIETSDLGNEVPDGISDRLVKVLGSFGVRGAVVRGIECGPVLVRIKLALPEGVKVSQVESLCDDIAMGLRVSKVSCTQIPEEGVLAVDIPAKTRKYVLPGSVKADVSGMSLPLELGVSVDGHGVAIDLAKAPHLLIAGMTGSGKSVCIGAIVASLIKNVDLRDFDLLLVDPKGVELGMFAKLPNCVNNRVLVSPEESMRGLGWLVDEMERRYALLAAKGCRNIVAYNARLSTMPISRLSGARMRYIVCVVDEFADLMLSSGAELTRLVQRLAQKSRAVGIHLVLATQRPSVKVITGDLKANLPYRIAFKVSSAVDSSTILGHGGAERLLGHGDMIIATGEAERRVHGVYCSDNFIDRVVEYVDRNTFVGFSREVDFETGTVQSEGNEWPVDLFNEVGRGRPAGDYDFTVLEQYRTKYPVAGYGDMMSIILTHFGERIPKTAVDRYISDFGRFGEFSLGWNTTPRRNEVGG